jgi:hypothetical protein
MNDSIAVSLDICDHLFLACPEKHRPEALDGRETNPFGSEKNMIQWSVLKGSNVAGSQKTQYKNSEK